MERPCRRARHHATVRGVRGNSPEFWQDFQADAAHGPTYTDCYPARMPDGRALLLPLRDLGETAVAGLIANQASFAVVDALAGWMAAAAAPFAPEIVVGLPTLGHVFGAAVARLLGQANWAALGTTRKLWYDEALYETARRIGAGIGLTLNPQSAGGGSDGNFTGALGIATLDGLGVQGAGGHTLDEHILVESLAARGRLMAGLLAVLD
jgi:hypothetical protein